MSVTPLPRLAAVLYDPGTSRSTDAALAEAAIRLRAAGLKVAGAIQKSIDRADRCACDVALEDLSSGRLIPISEDRGPLARGCRLDSLALEEVVGLSEAAVEQGADILIVNRFGKREAEGHGFRQAIEGAVARGIPVVVAVNRESTSGWSAFVGDLDDQRLASDPAQISAWCLDAHRQTA